jgi:G3E family GTPase
LSVPPPPSSNPPGDARIPVLVVSGFLGSGKTTLLRKLIAAPAFAESLVIVNEFGEIGIDHHLLERSDDRTVLLDNGCLCCELRGDLQELLVDVMMRRRRGSFPGFDRVFIETSGLATPGPVAQTLYGDRALGRDYRLACIATLVDAVGESGRAAAPDVATQQVAAADVVIVSKADQADDRNLHDARNWVATVNPFARCVVADHGAVDAGLFEGGPWQGMAAREPGPGRAGFHGDHPHDITSFALTFDAPVSRVVFRAFIETMTRMAGERLLRVKGIVRFDDAPRPQVVQGVRHVFEAPAELPRGATPPVQSALVFITRGLERRDVEGLWQSLGALAAAAPANGDSR